MVAVSRAVTGVTPGGFLELRAQSNSPPITHSATNWKRSKEIRGTWAGGGRCLQGKDVGSKAQFTPSRIKWEPTFPRICYPSNCCQQHSSKPAGQGEKASHPGLSTCINCPCLASTSRTGTVGGGAIGYLLSRAGLPAWLPCPGKVFGKTFHSFPS